MPQLHLYLPEEAVSRVRERARARGTSVSKYLASVVMKEVAAGWPPGYFDDVVGGWTGPPPARPPEGEFEEREAL